MKEWIRIRNEGELREQVIGRTILSNVNWALELLIMGMVMSDAGNMDQTLKHIYLASFGVLALIKSWRPTSKV